MLQPSPRTESIDSIHTKHIISFKINHSEKNDEYRFWNH